MAPSAVETPASPAEHLTVPLGEGVAAAALAETVFEALPHTEGDPAQKTEPGVEPKAAEEPSKDLEAEAEQPVVNEASAPTNEVPAPVNETLAVEAETPASVDEALAATREEASPAVGETPAPPSSQPPPPPAEWVLPPPPHPLFPVPKLPSEPAHMEIFAPPSLPLRRFDQDAVQALFMTEEALDLPKISRLAASLPGVYACVIATRDQACTGGNLPEGFDLAALLGLAPRVGEAAGRMPIGVLKHFTLYGEAYSVSFFERNGLSICAVHRPRSFVPGVREKLVALADELSR